jgi:hypothetical protein
VRPGGPGQGEEEADIRDIKGSGGVPEVNDDGPSIRDW